MTRPERFDELWTDYLEGELDPSGNAELHELLQEPRFLQAAQESYRTHRLLGIVGQSARRNQDEFIRQTLSRLPADQDHFVGKVMDSVMPEAGRIHFFDRHARLLIETLGLAVAVALLIGGFLWWGPDTDRETNTITIVELGGPVMLTGDGGKVMNDLEVGHSFVGGTLETMSVDAWARLRFSDQSIVTVSGRSLMTVSQNGQKVFRVRRGKLSANVTPQPAGKPMLIQTSTAELEVVGTQFNVDTESDSTKLVVNEGLVRMKRLADGNMADVPAAHQALVSAELIEPVRVERRKQPRDSWVASLKDDVSCGKWVSDFDILAIKLKKAVADGSLSEEQAFAKFNAAATDKNAGTLYAIPLLKSKLKSKKKPVSMQLVMLSIERTGAAPIIGSDSTTLRVRGRVQAPCDVTFGLTASNPNGGFGGKHFVTRSLETSQPDSGSFEIEIPLAEFRTGSGGSAVGKELLDCWMFTKSLETKLQIIEVELISVAAD